MSLADLMAEARRLAILQALTEDTDKRLSEAILRRWLAARVDDADRDQVRGDLLWLEEHGLLRLERLPAQPSGELWMATLRDAGFKVAKGRPCPGVATPDLD